MSADVDIRQLAIVREDVATPKVQRRRHVFSRYVVPGILIAGFLSLVAWASRDTIRPPKQVWVVPVMASQSAAAAALDTLVLGVLRRAGGHAAGG